MDFILAFDGTASPLAAFIGWLLWPLPRAIVSSQIFAFCSAIVEWGFDLALLICTLWLAVDLAKSIWRREWPVVAIYVVPILIGGSMLTFGEAWLRARNNEKASAMALHFLSDRASYDATYDDPTISVEIDSMKGPHRVTALGGVSMLGEYEFRVEPTDGPSFVVRVGCCDLFPSPMSFHYGWRDRPFVWAYRGNASPEPRP